LFKIYTFKIVQRLNLEKRGTQNNDKCKTKPVKLYHWVVKGELRNETSRANKSISLRQISSQNSYQKNEEHIKKQSL